MTLLAALLAVATAPQPFLAGAGSPRAEIEPARASLVIDTSSLREAGAGPAVARQLRIRGDAALRRAALVPGGSIWDPVVTVTVRPLQGPAIGYESRLVVLGRPGAGPARELRCPLCTEGELVAQLGGALEELVPTLADERMAP